MSKYIIHSCPERMWYVNNYLIPSIRDQGIDDVSAWCDWNHVGCLHSCMNNFMRMNDDGGTWHLQDDVIVSRNFKSRTEELEGSSGEALEPESSPQAASIKLTAAVKRRDL